MAATFVMSGVMHAQQPADRARDAAFQEAERYANCIMSNDVLCIEEMTHRERLAEAGLQSRELNRLRAAVSSREAAMNMVDFYRMEVAQPWPPFARGDELFAFVPYFETYGDIGLGRRTDRMAYLIGASGDDGESWRFIQVHEASVLRPEEIDRVIPGYGDRPLPEIRDSNVVEHPFARSRWLVTRARGFFPVDEAFAYALELEVREEIEAPIDLTIIYDDPADRDRPFRFRGSLEPGQTMLKWQSPATGAFELGKLYQVVIEGSNPDSGELVFEHRESLLFQPNREMWLAVWSKPPPAQP